MMFVDDLNEKKKIYIFLKLSTFEFFYENFLLFISTISKIFSNLCEHFYRIQIPASSH